MSASVQGAIKFAMVLSVAMLCFTSTPLHSQSASGGKPDFSGVWLPHGRKNIGVWPKQPPFTPAMLEARKEYAERHHPIDPEIDDHSMSCEPYTVVSAMMLIAQYPFEIVTTPNQITFIMESYGSVRRVYLDGRKPPAELLPSRMGFSTGRWEGDTLVVETTHLLPESEGSRHPASLERRVVERFSLIDSEEFGKELVNEMTVHDPVVYTEPVSVRLHYKWSPDIEVGEYFCHQDVWDQHMDGNPSNIPWRN